MTDIISPIDYRYGRESVKHLFSEENKFQLMLKVEMEICRAEEKLGLIPDGTARHVENAIKEGRPKLERMKEIEKETKHDVMAMIRTLSEAAPEAAPYIHLGATSNDINDTVTAIQLRDFFKILFNDLLDLQSALMFQIREHKGTVMLGRTHGQHSSPITFGLKMAVFLSEINRHSVRLMESTGRILVGKVMGPVGTGGFLGDIALDVQREVMANLHLNWEENPTQLVGRDRYIEYLSLLNNITVTLEKLGTEIRNLQRPEIGEVSESFDSASQVGSSSMPSKTNPIDAENICSISRLSRAMILPEYESSVQWHERDLTNSASERFTIPYASVLTDDILAKATSLVKNLSVHSERMWSNLIADKLAMSESAVKFLWSKKIPRQDAHEIVRRASMEAISKKIPLDVCLRNYMEKNGIDISGIEDAFNPRKFLGVSEEICEMTLRRTEALQSEMKDFIGGEKWIA